MKKKRYEPDPLKQVAHHFRRMALQIGNRSDEFDLGKFVEENATYFKFLDAILDDGKDTIAWAKTSTQKPALMPSEKK